MTRAWRRTALRWPCVRCLPRLGRITPSNFTAAEHLRQWCSWASRSRLEPFKHLSKTIKEHWDGILGFFPDRITSAAIEAINGVIQTARRRARGYRNFANFRAISYWMGGDLDLELPRLHPLKIAKPHFDAKVILINTMVWGQPDLLADVRSGRLTLQNMHANRHGEGLFLKRGRVRGSNLSFNQRIKAHLSVGPALSTASLPTVPILGMNPVPMFNSCSNNRTIEPLIY